MLICVVASWGVGFAVGGQQQHSEGSSTSARLVFLPADSEHAVVLYLSYLHIHVLNRIVFKSHCSFRFILLTWIFLQTKSMSHHLFLTSNMDVPRRQRFPDRFVDDIAALVCAISADIAGRYHKVLKIGCTLFHSKLEVFSDVITQVQKNNWNIFISWM